MGFKQLIKCEKGDIRSGDIATLEIVVEKSSTKDGNIIRLWKSLGDKFQITLNEQIIREYSPDETIARGWYEGYCANNGFIAYPEAKEMKEFGSTITTKNRDKLIVFVATSPSGEQRSFSCQHGRFTSQSKEYTGTEFSGDLKDLGVILGWLQNIGWEIHTSDPSAHPSGMTMTDYIYRTNKPKN
jgi:hypothetical protein